MQVHSVREYFATLDERFRSHMAVGVHAVFEFEVAGDDGGVYQVVVDDGTMRVEEGGHDSPTATIKAKDDDFVKLVNGQMNATIAVSSGKVKVTGDMYAAQKIWMIFPPSSR